MAKEHPDLRDLRREVAQAQDAQVRRVVETIDAMTSRSDADELLVPLRPRLERLHVPHPLRLPRLLFVPLDPLLVSPKQWRIGEHTLPRTVIVPMTRIVERALGAEAEVIKQAIRARTTADIELICTIGAKLWPLAATALASSEVPDRWGETGLSEKLFPALAAQVAALLHQSPALDLLVVETANGLMPPDRYRIEAMARAVTTACAEALPMLVILLVSRLPRAAGVLYDLATRRSLMGLNAGIEDATSLLLNRFERSDVLVANKGLSVFTQSVHRVATLLAELDHEHASRTRREQIRALRQRLYGDCQARFKSSMQDAFVGPLHAAATGAPDAAIGRPEDAARALRILEAEGRSIGVSAAYQDMMAEAVQAVEALPPAQAVTLTDRVRLLEILAGSETALAVLECASVSADP
ncbi:MAG: hypothetical protein ACJ8AI_31845 [Rhodopila sp.]